MAPGPELPHARWGRGAELPQAIPSVWTYEDSVFYRDADWYLRHPTRAACGSSLLPLPSRPKVAAPSWPYTFQLVPNASSCHDSARLLLSLPSAGSRFLFFGF